MRTLALFLVALLLNGCGSFALVAVSAIRVRRHFKRDFDCRHATMHDWDDGARLEGCGMVAFYWCDDNDSGNEYFKHYGRVTRAQVAHGVPVDAFKLTFLGDTCVLDHHYTSRLTFAPDASAAAKATMDDIDHAYFRATASFEGGRIELWSPRIHREYTLLKLFSGDPLIGDVSLMRDGAPVTVAARRQVVETELHFLIPTAQLHALEHASLAINAFGASYPLGEATLNELAKFEH